MSDKKTRGWRGLVEISEEDLESVAGGFSQPINPQAARVKLEQRFNKYTKNAAHPHDSRKKG